MAGILAAAAYVPRYRLPREVIAREWGGMPAPGERSVANHDEDALTICDADRVAIDVPLELTFRRLHDGGDFHNYFWKARPA